MTSHPRRNKLAEYGARIIGMMGIAAFLGSTCAQADPYIAMQLGTSWAHIPTTPVIANKFELDEQSTTARFALGTRHPWWSVEIGHSPRLSSRASHNVQSARDIDIRQDISTSALDLRGILTVPVDYSLQLRLIAGAAWVHMDNHEYGYNTADHAPTEWRNSESNLVPLFGIGMGWTIAPHIMLTLDATRINNAARSHWTLHSDITTVAAGLNLSF